MNVKPIWGVPAAVGIAVLLAACGGGAQTPSMGLPAAGVHASSWLSPDGGNNQGKCQNGQLAINPCEIELTSSNPGPVTIRVKQQGNHRVIVEKDNCASSGIATITEVNNSHFSVAAGSTTGSCTAKFNNGEGGVKAHITNSI